jgi:hypothetical protein
LLDDLLQHVRLNGNVPTGDDVREARRLLNPSH